MAKQSSDDGKSLGVLYTGYLEKRNPVTGSYKQRFVVLTLDSLHWFRRSEGYDLFGEERGQVILMNILSTRILDEDSSTFEIQGTDTKKRLFRAENQKECEEWVTAVRSAIKIMHDSHNNSKRGGVNRRTSLAGIKNLNFEGDILDGWNNNDSNIASEITTLLVSINSTTKHTEVVVARRPEWNHVISVPSLCRGDQLVVSMSNGGVVRLNYDLVLDRAETGEQFEAPVQGVTLASSLRITVSLEPFSSSSSSSASATGDQTKKLTYVQRLIDIAVALSNNRAAATNMVLALMVIIAGLASLRAVGLDTSLMFIFALLLSAHTMSEVLKQATRNDDRTQQKVAVRLVLHEHAFTSPDAPIVSPEDEIPQRFIDGCEGDMKEARRRWDITRHWREAEGVNGILEEPQPHFQLIKALYPHYHAGRGKEGHIIFWDRPGEFQGDQLKARGVTMDHLARHWLFMTEYQWEVLCNGDQTAKSIAVLDAAGIGMGDLAGSNLDFVKLTVGYANMHYPERSHVIYVINAPWYASVMWKIVKPWVHPNTQKKVRILSAKESLQGMQEHIDISNIPVYYGGKLDFGGGKDSCRFNSPEVQDLNEFVSRLNDKHATHVPFGGGGDAEAGAGTGGAGDECPPGAPGEVPVIYTQPSSVGDAGENEGGASRTRRASTMQQRQSMTSGPGGNTPRRQAPHETPLDIVSPLTTPSVAGAHGDGDWSVASATTAGPAHGRSPPRRR